MKDYHHYLTVDTGSSDIASLLLRGSNQQPIEVSTGYDGEYIGRIMPASVELPERYHKVLECNSWLKIYDDCGLSVDLSVNGKIQVFKCEATLALVVCGSLERVKAEISGKYYSRRGDDITATVLQNWAANEG